MIIPKVNIKNILSSDSSNSGEKTKEVNTKEQEKTSASPKEYNKEECLNNLWIELLSILFDENPKTTLKELMSSKKFSNQSYIERSSLDDNKKRENSESSIENNSSSPSTPSSKRNLFKIGGSHSRSTSVNATQKKSGKKEITSEPESLTEEEAALFNSKEEEVIDANAVINLDSKEFKQKLWECLFWSAGIEGLDTLLLRFIVAR